MVELRVLAFRLCLSLMNTTQVDCSWTLQWFASAACRKHLGRIMSGKTGSRRHRIFLDDAKERRIVGTLSSKLFGLTNDDYLCDDLLLCIKLHTLIKASIFRLKGLS